LILLHSELTTNKGQHFFSNAVASSRLTLGSNTRAHCWREENVCHAKVQGFKTADTADCTTTILQSC